MKSLKRILIFSLVFLAVFLTFSCGVISTDKRTIITTTKKLTTALTKTDSTTTVFSSKNTSQSTTIITTQSSTTQITTTVPTTALQTAYPIGIELNNNTKKFYYLEEVFNKDSLAVTLNYSDGTKQAIDSDDLAIRSFNSETIGKKTITIIYDRFLITTELYILANYAFPIEMPYYQETINLSDEALKITLHNIINYGFINLLYGDARYILDETDRDPKNYNNLILVYLGKSISSRWDGGYTWNREHVWPQSRLGVRVEYGINDFPSRATDLHNLKPADPTENELRSNYYFDWVTSNNTYEPRDEVKGDIARILFYMATMYLDLNLNDEPSTKSYETTMGNLSVLLEWNRQDPVDDFERNRNEIIYYYQNNRNPFIDYPGFADLIWGD